MMKNNFKSFVGNNKVLIIISLLLSIIIWVSMSLGSENESTTIISNIPIQINLSDNAVDDGLQIYSGNDQTASVTVTGNRVSIGSLVSSDINVSALTAGTITSPGTYPLSLTARKTDATGNFEITSPVSPSVITIFVDRPKISIFEIDNRIKYSVAEGYHGEVALSADTITIKGPNTEVSKVASVAIEGEIKGELTKDAEIQSDVILLDSSGSEISSSLITTSEENILATVSVSPEKEVPLKVAFTDKPAGLNVDPYVSIEPKSILICGPEDTLEKLDAVYTEPIDFTKLNNNITEFELDLVLSDKCMNLSETKTATVKINFKDFTKKRMVTNNFTVTGLSDEYKYNVTTESLSVDILGKKSSIDKLKPSDINCRIDASQIDGTTGSISLPVTVQILGSNSCWAYGEYKANITVTKV